MTRGHDDDGRFARFRGKEKIAFDQKFCRVGINFDRNNSFERNDKRTPRALARMAISHGRLSAILPTRNDKFYPRVQRRSSRAFSYVSSSRVCMCVRARVLGKMISLVPRGKATETMREHVVARLSSSVVNIRQNF